jgi:hypothetical protein
VDTDHTNFCKQCQAPQDQCLSVREQQWHRIAMQALREAPTAVHMVAYAQSRDTNDYGRLFGSDEVRFEEVDDQGNV